MRVILKTENFSGLILKFTSGLQSCMNAFLTGREITFNFILKLIILTFEMLIPFLAGNCLLVRIKVIVTVKIYWEVLFLAFFLQQSDLTQPWLAPHSKFALVRLRKKKKKIIRINICVYVIINKTASSIENLRFCVMVNGFTETVTNTNRWFKKGKYNCFTIFVIYCMSNRSRGVES